MTGLIKEAEKCTIIITNAIVQQFVYNARFFTDSIQFLWFGARSLVQKLFVISILSIVSKSLTFSVQNDAYLMGLSLQIVFPVPLESEFKTCSEYMFFVRSQIVWKIDWIEYKNGRVKGIFSLT